MNLKPLLDNLANQGAELTLFSDGSGFISNEDGQLEFSTLADLEEWASKPTWVHDIEINTGLKCVGPYQDYGDYSAWEIISPTGVTLFEVNELGVGSLLSLNDLRGANAPTE